MEAALFIMCSVARNLQPTEQEQNSCVPQIVEAVLGIPETFHLAVRHTRYLVTCAMVFSFIFYGIELLIT